MDPHPLGVRGFVGISADQAFERRLGRAIAAPEGARLGPDRRGQGDDFGACSALRSSGSKAAIIAWLASRLRLSSRAEFLGVEVLRPGSATPSIAALRTRMSSACQRSATAPASLPIEVPSVRSSGAMVALPPAAWMRSSTASSASPVRATRTTWAPAAPSASAVAAPIPRLAPVTSASLPAKGVSFRSFLDRL